MNYEIIEVKHIYLLIFHNSTLLHINTIIRAANKKEKQNHPPKKKKKKKNQVWEYV